MADPRTTVERALGAADVRPITLDSLHARRERQRRNQRLAAGAVGVSIALAGALIASQVVDLSRNQTGGAPPRNGVIAFEGNRGLFVSEPDGTGVHAAIRTLPEPPGECLSDRAHPCDYRGLDWSPDGTQLAFVFGEISAGLLGDMAIYVMDAATEEVRLLTRCPAQPGDPTGTCDNGNRLDWSPDGSRLVFSSGQDLFVADTASGVLTQITGCPSCSYEGVARRPAWSSSGDRIAFSGTGSLDVVNSDGTGWQTIVEGAEATFDLLNGDPVEWSPDGTKLTFSANEGIFVVGPDGSGLRLLVGVGAAGPTEGPGWPSWSPDGDRIVFVTTPGSPGRYRLEIRVVDLDGSVEALLYRSICCIQSYGTPQFSPDGSLLAFNVETDRADGAGVFVMTADGNDIHRLDGWNQPAWQGLPR